MVSLDNGFTYLRGKKAARVTRLLAILSFLAVLFFGCGHYKEVKNPNRQQANQADNSGKTPLIRAVLNESSAQMKMLLDAGAYVNMTDNQGKTALHHAAEHCYKDGINFLSRFQPNPKLRDIKGQNVLHKAAIGGCSGIIKYLLQLDMNIDAVDKMGYSPLMLAVEKAHLRATYLLLEQGASVNMRSNRGKTALYIAVETIQDTLVHHADSLQQEAASENMDQDEGDAAESRIKEVFSALWSSLKLFGKKSWEGIKTMAERIIPEGRDAPAREGAAYFDEQYEMRELEKRMELMRLLLDNGASPQQPGPKAVTPIALAKRKELDEVAQLLQKYQ